VNQQEVEMLPHQYTHISNFTKSLIRVECPNKGYGLLDHNFKEILPCQYSSLESLKLWQINEILPSRVYSPKRNFILKMGHQDSLYSFIDSVGNVLSSNSFHNPSRMKVFNNIIFDDISEGLPFKVSRIYKIKQLDGTIIISDSIARVTIIKSATGQFLIDEKGGYLSVYDFGAKCALFNLYDKILVSDYEYDALTLPPTQENENPKFIIGRVGSNLYLVGLDGKKISSIGFDKISMANNFSRKNLEGISFNDKNVEAFMKDANGEYFLMRTDLKIERISK